MPRWEALGRVIVGDDDPSPRVMGVVNVTPDSFSDGGQFADPSAALGHARALMAEGADLLDVGGESSRPGSESVAEAEELRRVVPAVDVIVKALDAVVSVDTTKAEVARQALLAGAAVVNDITALGADPGLTRVVADSGAGVVLMHMRGVPKSMQSDPAYADVVAEVYEFLARRVEAAVAAGIPRERVAIDPGIGFGKTFAHNLELLRNLRRFEGLGCVVLIGTSRKGLLGTITGRPAGQRAHASAVSALAAAANGARVVRVHDVGPTVDALKVWSAQVGWGR